MLLDVHFAYLIAAFAVLGGLTYTIGQFLDVKIEEAKQQRLNAGIKDQEVEAFQP